MRETRNTANGYLHVGGRMNGNSTRQIDSAIQDIFGGYVVIIKESSGSKKEQNILLFEKIVKRLQAEHNLDNMIRRKKIRVSRADLTIELI